MTRIFLIAFSILAMTFQGYVAQVSVKTAGTVTNVLRSGSTASWTTGLGNTTTLDGSYASTDDRLTADTCFTDYLDLTNFGFAIPATSAITGVQVNIYRGNSSQLHLYEETFQLLVGGIPVGVNYLSGIPWSSVYSYLSYGNPAYMWGTSLSPDQVNSSDFGFRIAVNRTTNSGSSNQRPRVDFLSIGISFVSILPVDLISFSAESINQTEQKITWETATEVNSKEFVLFKSVDGISFEEIGSLASTVTSTTLKKYQFTDRSINSTDIVYYKLLQIDLDGTRKEYDPISLSLTPIETDLFVYPNPGSEMVYLRWEKQFEPTTLDVYDVSGRVIQTIDLRLQNSVNMTDEPLGTYIFKAINEETGEAVMKRFVKE